MNVNNLKNDDEKEVNLVTQQKQKPLVKIKPIDAEIDESYIQGRLFSPFGGFSLDDYFNNRGMRA